MTAVAAEPTIFNRVVANDVCVGCGVCAGVAPPDTLRMRQRASGSYLPQEVSPGATRGLERRLLRACPFWDQEDDEDTLARADYRRQEGIRHRSELGYYLRCFAGRVADPDRHDRATSGGLGSWLARKLLREGKVDRVISVQAHPGEKPVFRYGISRTLEDLDQVAKSAYHPVEVSAVLREALAQPGRYLFVGLPCSVKAVKLAMREEPLLRTRIEYTVSLVCGHLKNRYFLDYLARCCGVEEDRVEMADFRKQIPGNPANRFAFGVQVRHGDDVKWHTIPMREVMGGDWGMGFFMHGACDVCDDVFGETADAAVGDVWLPEHIRDERGTSLVVCRRAEILRLIEDANAAGEVALEELPVDAAVRSQSAALRHRRDALPYRLRLYRKRGLWRPRKRFAGLATQLSLFRKCVVLLRDKLQRQSTRAFALQKPKPGLRAFRRRMLPWVFLYRLLYRLRSVYRRCARIYSRAN
ncbi:MAG: hypothetical protein GY719_23590 [bacterium]|nr:hypothetical protein [bacterium]